MITEYGICFYQQTKKMLKQLSQHFGVINAHFKMLLLDAQMRMSAYMSVIHTDLQYVHVVVLTFSFFLEGRLHIFS